MMLRRLMLIVPTLFAQAHAQALEGDEGFRGGRGGRIIAVTTLAADGPGSLRAAIDMPGPRIVVFEVGGVIDLNLQSLRVLEPDLTIAGQTAPAPGITLIRGGMVITAPQVIVEHLRIRPGEAGRPKRSGWEVDAVSVQGGAHDVLIRHCSLTWATDENASASGPRFDGKNIDAWREHTSHRVRFQNNLIAEGLAHSTHAKGEHSKGALVHDNARDIDFVGNLFAHNEERNPLYKGGASGSVVNNLIYNPGAKAMHYNLLDWEWQGQATVPGQLSIIGNVLRAGPSTSEPIALLALGGAGDLNVSMSDNIAVDRIGRALPQTGRYTTAPARLDQAARVAAPALSALPAHDVQEWVLRLAGARPWERDAIDQRIISEVMEDRGRVISSEKDVGGYPDHAPTRRAFDAGLWDLRSMRPKAAAGSPLCMGLECR
jgi:pectate lyase